LKAISKPVKKGIRWGLNRLGFDIHRIEHSKPLPAILGSYAPLSEVSCVGSRDNYFIHNGYQHRSAAEFFDDTSNKDLFQLEVYKFAREVSEREGFKVICDIGCGSGYKLVSEFSSQRFKTIGLDLPPTCAWLRQQYPDRLWMECDFQTRPDIKPDLVIASDVIEHLVNPDELLDYISALAARAIVFSTPERNLIRKGTHNGPSHNPAHVREWNFTEFQAYIDSRFEVLDHFISNSGQWTQCVLCRPRN
jgi:hypothetical protein